MSKRKIYLSTVLGLSILSIVLIIVITVMDCNYNSLLETNEELNSLIARQEANYEKSLKNWEDVHNETLGKYGAVLKENDRLKSGQTMPIYTYTKHEIDILARCVQAEAGNYKNHKNSQQYITQVILNRVCSKEYPNSIEEVVYDRKNGVQFSVAYNGMINKVDLEPETLANVYIVLVHGTDLPSNILFFYSDKVTNNWVNTLNTYKTVEGTVFAYK